MYSVYVGNTCIYDDTSTEKSLRLINPVLELADSAAGSFKMTVPVTNVGYTLINRMTSDISVHKDGEEMWMGRVIDESIDFWKNRTLTCEGELAFLNDSIQPPAEYHDQTVRGFLETLIGIHNSKVSEDRRFTVGAVTVTDPNDSLYRYTNYEKTIECINDKLVNRLGGHLIIRKENGVRYLDYLADKLSTNTQTIEFGTNLLDYAASYDMMDFATVLVPLGERLDESPISALEAYLTVASVNNNSIYVQNTEAVQNYGWIEKVVHFDRVTVASNLLTKAQQYLSSIQFDSMILEVKAIDLHYLNPEIEGVKLSDQIRVISTPHGLDKIFPVMKLSIPLDHPENTQFTLGTKITTTLTAANNKVNTEILQQIESLPTKQSVLEEAQENAQEIMDLISNGFITITTNQNGSQELFIADNQDLLQATRFWRWNVNGLAYGTKTAGAAIGTATYSIAMTMDGSIVADRITTGTLRADLLTALKVKASTLTIVNESDPSQAGETLASVIQRFEVSDGQLSSEISGLSQVAVKTVEVYYALGDSQTTAPSTGWSTTAPAWEEGKYMWQKTLTIFADDTVAVPHRSWSNPTCIQGAAGQDGDPGYNTAIVSLYKRSSTAATVDWTITLTYYFTGQNAHHLNAVPSGWSESIPASDGNPLYVTAATAYANTGSDTIAYTEWSAPVKMAEDGTSGNPGTNSATVFLYQRAASIPSKPSGNLEYTFSDGSLTGTLGSWTQQIPTSDGNPCYVIQATAVSTSATDIIADTEWSSQRVLVEDGSDGDPGVGISRVVPEYYLSTSASTQSGGSWSTTCPAWQSGKYIWTRSHVYYDNNTDSTTTPVLDNAVNGLGSSYTEIKQTMNSLTLTAASGSVEVGTLSSEAYPSGVYRFSKTSDGYYTSSNAGVDSSVCYGKLTFNFQAATVVTLDCISDGESAYDFGMISNVDIGLSQSMNEDTSAYVYHSFKNEGSPNPQILTMEIPSGSHYITFKYRKDSSTSSGNDYFKIKTYTGPGDRASRISLNANGTEISSADVRINGMVTFSDLSGTGTTEINGANIMTGTISADSIHVNDVYYGLQYKVLTSQVTTTSRGSDLRTKLGISNNTRPSDVASTEIYGYHTIFYDDIIGVSSDYKLEIQCDGERIVPGEDGNWDLGDSGAPFRRLYLHSSPTGYLWYDDTTDELLFRYGTREYTIVAT